MRNTSIDWRDVERDYREGRLSLRQLALKHRCSHSTIANFAGRHGWTRDGCPCDRTVAPTEWGTVHGDPAHPAADTRRRSTTALRTGLEGR
jgi:hypothetical protein